MSLIIQWGHKRTEETTTFKELSFKGVNQIPLMMLTTLMQNNKTGRIEYGWVNFTTDGIFDRKFYFLPKSFLKSKERRGK